jgi:hypothetical protein
MPRKAWMNRRVRFHLLGRTAIGYLGPAVPRFFKIARTSNWASWQLALQGKF